MLCMTVISHEPPTSVMSTFSKPFLSFMGWPSGVTAPVISQCASTEATSGLMNRMLLSFTVRWVSLKIVVKRGALNSAMPYRPLALSSCAFVKSASSLKTMERAFALWLFQAVAKSDTTFLIAASSPEGTEEADWPRADGPTKKVERTGAKKRANRERLIGWFLSYIGVIPRRWPRKREIRCA